jgi:ADP-heptose:LPS heptosyltransferase
LRILALQLKRIGDLVLTTPALRALRTAWPEANITLGVMGGTSPLLAAIPFAQSGIIFAPGRGWAPWQQVLTGGWDMCFDFTGNDRSAFATALSMAKSRVGFEWVRRNRFRALAYNAWSPSKVREVHTAQHYVDLVAQAVPGAANDLRPQLSFPWLTGGETLEPQPYALLHPGTARAEKYWQPERWGELARHLHDNHGLRTIFTCGHEAFERSHMAAIPGVEGSQSVVRYPRDLLWLAGFVAGARIVISCDTSVVHLASAFRVPQIALFGPTNPFHWRPMHDRAVVFSATHPDAPLTEFAPRMRGAPMELISTVAVIRAIDALLALPRPS